MLDTRTQPRADNDWSDAPGCWEKDVIGTAFLRTLKALWAHRRAVARYVRTGRLEP